MPTTTLEGYAMDVTLRGEFLGRVTVELDEDYANDPDEFTDPSYKVESDEEIRYASDESEARWCLADMARDIRNAHRDVIAEREADEATETVERLVGDGRAADVLKALRAAGLI